jgi:RNA polymerase sigma factor (sigma-70 family)
MDRLPENRELLDAFRRAEPEALRRVYLAYIQEVAGFLRAGFNFTSGDNTFRFVGYGEPEDLKDVLQETFMNALGESARRGYNGLTPFKAYVLGIAKNVVLQRFRRDLTRVSRFVPLPDPAGSEQAVPECLQSSMPAPDRVTEQGEIRRLVQSFIQDLDEEQRQVLRLYFMDQQSQEVVAATLGVDRNRVRKLILQLRKKLLKRLQKAGLDRVGNVSLQGMEV